MSIFNDLLRFGEKIQESLISEANIISDSDIPSGSGGINREGYTYGELRRQPIIQEVMRGITDPTIQR